MATPRLQWERYTEYDLDFVIAAAAPEVKDRQRLKQAIREDEAFRAALIGHEKVLQRMMTDEEALVRVSPSMYFEVLLRKSNQELHRASHTVERTGGQKIAVFDAAAAATFLSKQEVLEYLTQMLASFTRVESYAVPVRVRPGVWHKVRYNDTDIDSLIRLCESVAEEQRLRLYKRIADVCLFVLGIFPEHAPFDYRHPGSGVLRPLLAGKRRRGVEEYEEEARRFYKLAGAHPAAQESNMAQVFGLLHENLSLAKKPLNFISEHYLTVHKARLFEGAR